MLIQDAWPAWAQHYCHHLNRHVYGSAAAVHRAADESFVFVELGCKARHLTHKQARTFYTDYKNGLDPLRCPYCTALPAATKTASEWEHLLLGALTAEQLHFTVETCVVRGWSAPQDYWLYQKNIIVQCDGEHHEGGKMHGADAAAQLSRDRRFNSMCWQQGLRVVRVHRLDADDAVRDKLRQAVQLATDFPSSRFVLFTPNCRQQDWRDLAPPSVPFSPVTLKTHPFITAIKKAFDC